MPLWPTVILPAHVSFVFIDSYCYLASWSVSYLSLTPAPKSASPYLYWFSESSPTKSLHWSDCLPVTLLLRKITGLCTDLGSPGTLSCQTLSCPGLTHDILFCNLKCDLEIGVFAYLYVWMQYLVATTTCANSSLRGLVLCFVSQKSLPCRFSEKRLWEAG